ncbi:hypothetical protein SAMN06272771_0132 [Streptomyces sp. Ag82_O1-12]|nr:hypothetical protein SAMN06272771_0132 [Streptomyces sp. Ag82_O1-12]SOD42885.1 hypothetical protein SAMN06272727_0122 [Streptomyces sp. Ag82_G6-1]
MAVRSLCGESYSLRMRRHYCGRAGGAQDLSAGQAMDAEMMADTARLQEAVTQTAG